MRRAARNDNNQQEIVEALRKAGIAVWPVRRPLDLLCCNPVTRKTVLLEVKGKGKPYTDEQLRFIAMWPGDWARVETREQALTAMGVLWNG